MSKTLGRYRKVYAQGLQQGRRINSVSLEAEAWLWRLQSIADDYGNLPDDPDVIRGKAAPKRKLSPDKVAKLTGELVVANLVTRYTAEGDGYLHCEEFERTQTSPNGKLVQRYPLPPTFQMNPENPDASGSPKTRPDQTKPEPMTETKTRPERAQPEPAKPQASPNGPRVGGGSGSVRAEFHKLGINPAVATALGRGGVTVAEIQATLAEIRSDKTIRKPMAVLVHRLCEAHGLTLQRGKGIDPEFVAFQAEVESLERRAQA